MRGISFGDIVRMVVAPETSALGVAGKEGVVFGMSVPSSSGVSVVGKVSDDLAYNVFFDDLKKGWWFAPELVEFVGSDAGAVARLDGVPKKWVKQESGEWLESDEYEN